MRLLGGSLAVVVSLLVGSAATAPAIGSTDHAGQDARRPAAPMAGRWKAHVIAKSIASGSFTVTKGHRYVTDLRLVPGSSVGDGYCGTVPVKILGEQPIHRVAGKNGNGDYYDNWIVGRDQPKYAPQYKPIKVKAQEGHNTPYAAQLLLLFHGALGSKTKTNGDVGWTLPGTTCGMQFTFTKQRH